MLSSVLRSPRAVQVNIEIMRVFVSMRRFAMTNEQVDRRLTALQKKYDGKFRDVFDAIRNLIEAEKPKPTLGFGRKEMG